MSDLKLTADGDLDLSTGDVQIFSGIYEIKQRVIITLQFFKGEWFRDTSFGIPYFEQVFGKAQLLSDIRMLIIRAIEGVPNVTKVTQIVLTANTQDRSLTVEGLQILANGELIDFQSFPVLVL